MLSHSSRLYVQFSPVERGLKFSLSLYTLICLALLAAKALARLHGCAILI